MIPEIERESTMWHSLESSLWKRVWSSPKKIWGLQCISTWVLVTDGFSVIG